MAEFKGEFFYLLWELDAVIGDSVGVELKGLLSDFVVDGVQALIYSFLLQDDGLRNLTFWLFERVQKDAGIVRVAELHRLLGLGRAWVA